MHDRVAFWAIHDVDHAREERFDRIASHDDRSSQIQANLFDPHPGDGPADHQLLDLFGAFEDVVDLIWSCPQISSGVVYDR